MTEFRKESDLLGERSLPADALYGIHTLRACENFPLSLRPVRPALTHAYGAVKLACARANRELGIWNQEKANAIEAACEAMMRGELDSSILVDALQGGAGTSTNMNVNEVLANRALQFLGRPLGEYTTISPLDDINRHQSTNDTYPTALKVAAIGALRNLEKALIPLIEAFQAKEKAFADVVKIGRTEMQDAVLITLGREMGAYAECLSRDRWRIFKCEERLRVVNLGGTAIGTGLSAPRPYIFRVVEHLRQITGFGLSRAENLVECTQNADVWVEVSGMLKTCATNLFKIANDLRFLSSGPDAGIGEIRLPARQAGSSIMPGKVNPVIPEAVIQAMLKVMGNDAILTQACALGNLELNPFLPLIAETLLESLELLTNAAILFRTACVEGIEADRTRCRSHVEGSTAVATALLPLLGYERCCEIVRRASERGESIRTYILREGILDKATFEACLSPEAVTRLGTPDLPPSPPRAKDEDLRQALPETHLG